MAAGLDAAAGVLGVVSVAQQLVSSMVKIRNFCTDVKNAPEELLDTIANLEHFGKILAKLGEKQSRATNEMKNADFLTDLLHMSRNAADRIAALVLDLQSEMQRHRFRTAAKTVLKQKTINAMMTKLDRSKQDLH